MHHDIRESYAESLLRTERFDEAIGIAEEHSLLKGREFAGRPVNDAESVFSLHNLGVMLIMRRCSIEGLHSTVRDCRFVSCSRARAHSTAERRRKTFRDSGFAGTAIGALLPGIAARIPAQADLSSSFPERIEGSVSSDGNSPAAVSLDAKDGRLTLVSYSKKYSSRSSYFNVRKLPNLQTSSSLVPNPTEDRLTYQPEDDFSVFA